MGTDPHSDDRLKDLDARIKAARGARVVRSKRREEATVGSLAWRMVTELVVGILVGGAMGWGLDSLFGTLPVFLILMGIVGFAAGVRLVMRSADDIRRSQAAETAKDESGERDGRSGH